MNKIKTLNIIYNCYWANIISELRLILKLAELGYKLYIVIIIQCGTKKQNNYSYNATSGTIIKNSNGKKINLRLLTFWKLQLTKIKIKVIMFIIIYKSESNQYFCSKKQDLVSVLKFYKQYMYHLLFDQEKDALYPDWIINGASNSSNSNDDNTNPWEIALKSCIRLRLHLSKKKGSHNLILILSEIQSLLKWIILFLHSKNLLSILELSDFVKTLFKLIELLSSFLQKSFIYYLEYYKKNSIKRRILRVYFEFFLKIFETHVARIYNCDDRWLLKELPNLKSKTSLNTDRFYICNNKSLSPNTLEYFNPSLPYFISQFFDTLKQLDDSNQIVI